MRFGQWARSRSSAYGSHLKERPNQVGVLLVICIFFFFFDKSRDFNLSRIKETDVGCSYRPTIPYLGPGRRLQESY